MAIAEMFGPPMPAQQRTLGAYVQRQQEEKQRPENLVSLANAQATRNLPITPQLTQAVNRALLASYGPGYAAQVYSGGQPAIGSGKPRVGSTRHDDGNAADLYVVDPQGNRLSGDRLAPLARYWLQNQYGGVGLEMRGGGIHLDTHRDRAPVWTYGAVSPEQAAVVREFGGRAPTMVPNRSLPMMAQAGAPQAVTPGAQVAGVGLAPAVPMTAPEMGAATALAQFFEIGRQADEAKRRQQEEADAIMARRRALFG